MVPLLGILLPIPGPVFNELGCLSCDKPVVVGGFNPDLLAGENTGICEMETPEVANFGGLTPSAVGAGAEVDAPAGEIVDNGLLKIDDFVPLIIGKGKDEGAAVRLLGGTNGRSPFGGAGRNINLLIAPKILGGLRPLGSVDSSSSSSCVCLL